MFMGGFQVCNHWSILRPSAFCTDESQESSTKIVDLDAELLADEAITAVLAFLYSGSKSKSPHLAKQTSGSAH